MQVTDTNLGNFTPWVTCLYWLNLPEAKKDFTDVKFLIIHQIWAQDDLFLPILFNII